MPRKVEIVGLHPSIKLVLLDIDGTLLDGSSIELENVRWQLSRLQRYNVRFSVATGRTIAGSRDVLHALDARNRIRWIISYNGGVIAKSDASPWIERNVICAAAYSALIDQCRIANLQPLVYTCQNSFDVQSAEKVFTEESMYEGKSKEFNNMRIIRVPRLSDIPKEDIVAVLVSDPLKNGTIVDYATNLRKVMGSTLRVTTSGGAYVEIGHPNSTKLISMKRLCEMEKISTSEVMAIGDNFNDLEMLSACGLGCAVSNSPQEVKQVCHFVSQYRAAGGVVDALRMLLNSLRADRRKKKFAKD